MTSRSYSEPTDVTPRRAASAPVLQSRHGTVLARATMEANTSTAATAGRRQPGRSRRCLSADTAPTVAANPETRLPTCATSESGAATEQLGGQNTIEYPLVRSVHPNASTATLASPPPTPLAEAEIETAHQSWI